MTINFIYIGPPKSGSSWLYETLNSHPDVFVPSIKDIFFFDRYYHRGLAWYESHFADAEQHQCIGELSHDYMYSQQALSRIKTHYPNVKIILVLRDPVERAWSHFNYSRMMGNVSKHDTLGIALSRNPNIVQCSAYDKALVDINELFPIENIAVFDFEDIRDQPMNLRTRLFEFLELIPPDQSQDTITAVNKAAQSRSPVVTKQLRRLVGVLRNMGLQSFVAYCKKSPFRKVLFVEQPNAAISAAERSMLETEIQKFNASGAAYRLKT